MIVWGALAGGALGTLALTSALRTASELRLTRMDLPFLLGTAVSADRGRARAIGYALHLVAGLLFALLYAAVFAAIGRSGWWLGATFGLAHGVFAATALVNILLPIIHPRMGTPNTAAVSVALIESPGFLMRNYGTSTALVSLVAHVGYGTIVGGFASLAAS